jgi:hypothetical protein
MLLDTIEETTIVDIQVNGAFYKRIQALFFSMVQGKEPQHLQEMFDKIQKNQIDSEDVAHLQTIVVLMREIEEQAKAQDKITKAEVNPEDINTDLSPEPPQS